MLSTTYFEYFEIGAWPTIHPNSLKMTVNSENSVKILIYTQANNATAKLLYHHIPHSLTFIVHIFYYALSLLLDESNYESITIGHIGFTLCAGILQSLSINQVLRKLDINRIESLVDLFGNTFTSFCCLVSTSALNKAASTTDSTGFMDSFGRFLWTLTVCCLCFECIQMPMDWILNFNQSFGRINAPKHRSKWTVSWTYIRRSCYFVIGISFCYFIVFEPLNVLQVINCTMASIASYFATIYISEYLSTSPENLCYAVNISSCILVLIDFKLFHSQSAESLGFISKHFDIFILSFSSCFSQFTSTVVFPHKFWNQNQPEKAARFLTVNLVIAAVFIEIVSRVRNDRAVPAVQGSL